MIYNLEVKVANLFYYVQVIIVRSHLIPFDFPSTSEGKTNKRLYTLQKAQKKRGSTNE